MPAAQAPATDAAIEQSVRSAKASGKRVAAVGQVGMAHQIFVGDELEVLGHRFDLDGLWSISAKEKPGRRHRLTCLEVDQLLERTTSLIPGILLEDGVAVPDLGGWIEVGYGYPPAMVAVPEEHAPPDGRDRGAFGRWEAQRSKLEYAAHELASATFEPLVRAATVTGDMPKKWAFELRSLHGHYSHSGYTLDAVWTLLAGHVKGHGPPDT